MIKLPLLAKPLEFRIPLQGLHRAALCTILSDLEGEFFNRDDLTIDESQVVYALRDTTNIFFKIADEKEWKSLSELEHALCKLCASSWNNMKASNYDTEDLEDDAIVCALHITKNYLNQHLDNMHNI